jgi:ABC-type multidrug transport system fused ATPase/permease subunit
MVNGCSQQINELGPNLDSLLERLNSLEAAATPVGRIPIDRIADVVLADVGYDYDTDRPGISGISLSIQPGEAVGVIGPSGSGKSTLVQVLLGLRRPSRGEVKVSGVRLEDIEPKSWHRLVALVPQEPRLLQGTVAENIRFLRPHISRAQVEAAA